MGTGRLPFLRPVGLSILLLAVGLLSAKPAQADPHGVFFTVVGQQQLFFNILAALNQADYVEPLNLRTQLRQRRDESTYVSSQHSALSATQTELADVLTRSVSLEGQDVRTQERADEYAREVVRQRQAAELIGQLCREAFGDEDCVFETPENQQADQKQYNDRQRAFVQNPVEYNLLPTILGAGGVLSSGTDDHTAYAEKLVDQAEQGGEVLPFAYSEEISTLRKAAAQAGGDVEHLVLDMIGAVENEYLGGIPNPEQLAVLMKSIRVVDICENNQGVCRAGEEPVRRDIQFQPVGNNLSPEERVAQQAYFRNVWTDLQDSISRLARGGERRVAQQLETADGAIADRVHDIQEGLQGDRFGEVGVINTAPANVKEGLQEQLLPALLALEGNPAFTDPTQIDTPGGVSAVDREGEAPLKVGTPLEPFSKADVIEKGLLEQSGVTKRPNLNFSRNDLQNWIFRIFDKRNL